MQPHPSDSAGQPRLMAAPWVRQSLDLARRFRHLVPFALVGASGLLVNSAILAAATHALSLGMLPLSAALATVGSTTWNFTLTEVWVFRDRQRPGWPRRLVMFFIMNNAALLLRVPIINELTFGLHIHYLISNLISIGTVTLVRYLFSDALIWRVSGRRQPTAEEK